VPKLLYNIFIKIYPYLIKIVSPFNIKAKQWITGRQDVFNKLQSCIEPNTNLFWMHCASLGEFEQGRPVLERLKVENPSVKILLTFFSPSGYEVRKNYEGADFIFYLPIDSAANASKFLNIVHPSLIVFVKYEFWFYYLAEAKKRHIPLLLVSGIFRKDQPFFKWYGGLHRQMLKSFTQLFVQNHASAVLLRSIGIDKNVMINGDTRFDRVIEIAEKFEPIPAIEAFCKNSKVIVAGSTWTEDDKELDHFANLNLGLKFIIAPHNINNDRIAECKRLYKHSILYSEVISGANSNSFNTIIIDNIGMLSRLYNYATVCLVGGAFGAEGVHNVLEAAVYGKPVVFGPVYEKYFEAVELVEHQGAFIVENALALEKTFQDLLTDNSKYSHACNAAKQYVYSKQGATDSIINYIQENRLLTN
jgi:3-deoxy-D-manno-octulosonic-acid transferase